MLASFNSFLFFSSSRSRAAISDSSLETYIVMALYSYGPIWLWPDIVMALYSYGPIWYIIMARYSYGPIQLWPI